MEHNIAYLLWNIDPAEDSLPTSEAKYRKAHFSKIGDRAGCLMEDQENPVC